MSGQQLASVIAGSALVTLDGTAITVILPAIGRELNGSLHTLQWTVNTSLLAMAALLLPAGALVDRYGQTRVMRMGLLTFATASLACSLVATSGTLIGARFVQGVGAALILPAALALLRGACPEPVARARILGLWAAWTGVAGAVGPLLAGLLADAVSWRAVFMVPSAGGLAAALLLTVEPRSASTSRARSIPARATASLMAFLGGTAYLVMTAKSTSGTMAPALGAAIVAAAAGAVLFVRDAERTVLLPREMMTSRNCLAANGVTFALYCGMFGLSFVVALYTQYVLEYSPLITGLVLLPISLMLLFAERFGKLSSFVGVRVLVAGGSAACAAGIAWIGVATHPVPVWVLATGCACFGLGLSIAVSPLTHAAVAAVPESCAGAASALNHASVRAAGLVAVALLGSIAADPSAVVSADGVRRAMMVCAAIVALGGLTGGLLLHDDEPGGLSKHANQEPQKALSCEAPAR